MIGTPSSFVPLRKDVGSRLKISTRAFNAHATLRTFQLPIFRLLRCANSSPIASALKQFFVCSRSIATKHARQRSEEHTSELQSRRDLVCRLLLEKKKPPGIASRPGPSKTTPPTR